MPASKKEKTLACLEQFNEDRKAFYPKRGGDLGLKRARVSYIKRREDFTREEIAQSFERYRDYCIKLGHIGTSFVKMLSTFLNNEENITCDWEVIIYEQRNEGSASRMLERCRAIEYS